MHPLPSAVSKIDRSRSRQAAGSGVVGSNAPVVVKAKVAIPFQKQNRPQQSGTSHLGIP